MRLPSIVPFRLKSANRFGLFMRNCTAKRGKRVVGHARSEWEGDRARSQSARTTASLATLPAEQPLAVRSGALAPNCRPWRA